MLLQRKGKSTIGNFGLESEGKKKLMNQIMYLSYSLNDYCGDEEEIKEIISPSLS